MKIVAGRSEYLQHKGRLFCPGMLVVFLRGENNHILYRLHRIVRSMNQRGFAMFYCSKVEGRIPELLPRNTEPYYLYSGGKVSVTDYPQFEDGITREIAGMLFNVGETVRLNRAKLRSILGDDVEIVDADARIAVITSNDRLLVDVLLNNGKTVHKLIEVQVDNNDLIFNS